jgi:hypothetical protein
LRQPLVDEGVVGVEQLEVSASSSNQVLEEHLVSVRIAPAMLSSKFG